MYKKAYLSFRFITTRPLCLIKQGDQTPRIGADGLDSIPSGDVIFKTFLQVTEFLLTSGR